MPTRLSVFLVLTMLATSLGVAQDDGPLSAKVGDPVVLELTGKPAIALLTLFNQAVPDVSDGDFGIPLEGRIIRIEGDNLIADFRKNKPKGAEAQQLITISASFHRRDLNRPSVYSTPQANANTEEQRLVQAIRARHESLPKIRKRSFDGVTIRLWSLLEEITE